MKKSLTSFATILLLSLISCQPSKEQMKKEFVTSCIREADKEITDSTIRIYMHEYCDCAGDKAVNTLTVKEWKEMGAEGEYGKERLQARLKPIVQSCMDTLQMKLDKTAGNGQGVN